MKQSDLDRLEQLLLKERDRALDDLQNAEDEEASGQRESSGELSRMPFHMADAASDTQEAEKDMAVVNRESGLLSRIDEALRVLREDPRSYGRCSECGTTIAMERLEIVPWTRLCASCAEDAEAAEG